MQINKASSVAIRFPVSRLICIILVSAGVWACAFAQNDARVGQGERAALQSLSDQTSDLNAVAISSDDPGGLSMFFIIGIAINVIVIASFAVWFAREWNRKSDTEDRE